MARNAATTTPTATVTVQMQPDQVLLDQMARMTNAFEKMSAQLSRVLEAKGDRLSHAQFAAYLGIHRNTLRKRLDADHTMPRPGTDGKWLLSEVIEWQKNCNH